MEVLDREFCQVCGVEKTDQSPVGHNDDSTGQRMWWCSQWCMEKPKCVLASMPLLLIRGLPGAGKSTMAKSVVQRGYFDIHLEADMFHMNRGRYNYKVGSAREAHLWCLNTTRVMLNNGKRVVVSNTFITLDELRPYLELGFDVAVEKAPGAWASTHDVPIEIIDHMRKRWQELP